MSLRKTGKILCEHEERLVYLGVDPDEVTSLVDILEQDLYDLGEENEADQFPAYDDQPEEETEIDEG